MKMNLSIDKNPFARPLLNKKVFAPAPNGARNSPGMHSKSARNRGVVGHCVSKEHGTSACIPPGGERAEARRRAPKVRDRDIHR